MTRWLVPMVALAALVGCDGDADGDGLSNKYEEDLGTDPESPDSDGDTVSDSDEVHMGANPLSDDSDGDGYRDPDEIAEGSDPTDGDDWIYAGGWPFNPSKDDIDAPEGFEKPSDNVSPEDWNGDTFPRFVGKDQHGDVVDLYDFAFQGKPIVVDVSELNCYWCEEMAKLLEGETTALSGYGFEPLAEMIENGEIYWITVLDGDFATGTSDYAIVDQWVERYPEDRIPVLYDDDAVLLPYLAGLGWPTMILLEEDMTVGYYHDNYGYVLDEAVARGE